MDSLHLGMREQRSRQMNEKIGQHHRVDGMNHDAKRHANSVGQIEEAASAVKIEAHKQH